jgi:hypothetical protein
VSKIISILINVIISDSMAYRKGKMVTSEEGKVLQAKTWDEMLQILRKFAPEIDGILNATS